MHLRRGLSHHLCRFSPSVELFNPNWDSTEKPELLGRGHTQSPRRGLAPPRGSPHVNTEAGPASCPDRQRRWASGAGGGSSLSGPRPPGPRRGLFPPPRLLSPLTKDRPLSRSVRPGLCVVPLQGDTCGVLRDSRIIVLLLDFSCEVLLHGERHVGDCRLPRPAAESRRWLWTTGWFSCSGSTVNATLIARRAPSPPQFGSFERATHLHNLV